MRRSLHTAGGSPVASRHHTPLPYHHPRRDRPRVGTAPARGRSGRRHRRGFDGLRREPLPFRRRPRACRPPRASSTRSPRSAATRSPPRSRSATTSRRSRFGSRSSASAGRHSARSSCAPGRSTTRPSSCGGTTRRITTPRCSDRPTPTSAAAGRRGPTGAIYAVMIFVKLCGESPASLAAERHLLRHRRLSVPGGHRVARGGRHLERLRRRRLLPELARLEGADGELPQACARPPSGRHRLLLGRRRERPPGRHQPRGAGRDRQRLRRGSVLPGEHREPRADGELPRRAPLACRPRAATTSGTTAAASTRTPSTAWRRPASRPAAPVASTARRPA